MREHYSVLCRVNYARAAVYALAGHSAAPRFKLLAEEIAENCRERRRPPAGYQGGGGLRLLQVV